MKAVVYYSLKDNSKYVAEKITECTCADTLRLETVKAYPTGNVSKFIWGGKSVVFGETPKLSTYTFDVEKYDTIIIGTPVWAGSFAPPVKSFLKENKLFGKRIALFACSSGGNAEKCFEKLKQELHTENIIATLSLIDPFVKKSDENDIRIKEFCKKI